MYHLATVYPNPWRPYQYTETFGIVYTSSTITEPSFGPIFYILVTSKELQDKGITYHKGTRVSQPQGALSKLRKIWHNLDLKCNNCSVFQITWQ